MKRKVFTIIAMGCMLATTLTGCSGILAENATNNMGKEATSTENTGQYDAIIIQEAKANVKLDPVMKPIYTDPALLPIHYEVELKAGKEYNITIGEEVVTTQLPEKGADPDSIHWRHNEEKVTEGKVWELLQKAKKKVVAYIKSSQIIRNKEECISKINQIPMFFVDSFDPGDGTSPDAFYYAQAIWVMRGSKDSICEWMFTHELIHFLNEITNNKGKRPGYSGTLFDECMTDIICSSLKPALQGRTSGYAKFYDPVYKYLEIWQEDAIEAYFYGYDKLWNKTGKSEFEVFVWSIHCMEENVLSHDCVAFTLAKWKNLYSKQ